MKKLLSGILLAVLVLALAACGTKNDRNEDKTSGSDSETAESELTKLVIGASNTPHAIILEKAEPLLKEKGIELEIETYKTMFCRIKTLKSEKLMQTISNTFLILKHKLLITDTNLLMQVASISNQSVFIQKNISHLKNFRKVQQF